MASYTRNRLSASSLASQLRQQRQYKIEEAKRIEEEKRLEEKKKNASFWERAGDTILDFGANLVGGASKSIEGFIDAGSSLVGNVAGWLGDEGLKEQMERNIAYDWTGNNILNPANELTDTSLLNDGWLGQTIEGVASGVGQLLPNVAISLIPGAGAVLSKVYLFTSATGNSTESALNEGANLGQATGFGLLSGGIELLSEGISSKLFGANAIDKATGVKDMLGKSIFKTAKSGIGRMAQDAVGEGLEEAFAEVMNPLLKKITYDVDNNEFLGREHLQSILDSAVVGALTSVAFGGTVGQLPTYKNSSRISRIQDEVVNFNNQVDKLYQDAVTGKINTEQREVRIKELQAKRTQVENDVANIMAEFKKGSKFTEASRQKGLEQALKIVNASDTLKNRFNSDGTLNNAQVITNQNNVQPNVVASVDNGTQTTINQAQTKAINKQAISTTLEGRENILQFKPTSNQLTTSMQESISILSDLSKAFGHNIDYVVADKNVMKGKKGAFDKTNNVIYIREDLKTSDVIKETIVHEFTHMIEGTTAYNRMADFVKSQLKSDKNLAKEFGIENFDSEYNALKGKYENAGAISSEMSKAEQKSIVDSEVIAKYISEKLFTDESSIKKFCKTNPSVGQKVLGWIKDIFGKLSSASRNERQVKAFLQKARNLYTRAIEEAGVMQSQKNLVEAKIRQSGEIEQKVDNNPETKYNLDDEIEKYFDNYDYDKSISTIDKSIEHKKQLISKLIKNKQIDGAKNHIKELEVLKNERSKRDNERTYQARKRTNPSSKRQRWKNFFTTTKFISQIQGKDAKGFNDSKEFRQQFREIVETNNLFLVSDANDVGYKLVKNEYIPNCLKPIIKEDKMFNIQVGFFVETKGKINPTGVHLKGSNFIAISINENDGDFIKNHKHERYHVFSQNNKSYTKYFESKIYKLLSIQEINTLFDSYFHNYKEPYRLTQKDYEARNHPAVWEEIYAQLYSGRETIKKQTQLEDAIKSFESMIKARYGIRQGYDIKFSIDEDVKTNDYGKGYSTKNVDVKEYNLVNLNEDSIKDFNNLLNNLKESIRNDEKMNQTVNLRLGLFDCLQNQNNNVYSRLGEINDAYFKTKNDFEKNKSINIVQTFIQSLGYNGVIDGDNSIIYDLDKKKENLLDYSKDRAQSRLDKAIKLFGETKNPEKAGWLLSDGRFVDYNRDSANILKEANDFVLDYQDHWQIEKVFDTRRGTDAIDAFMAEGNIRLMPEAGGIELRGKPNNNQIDKLEEYINKVIAKKGITLDLRPAGTTENHKPNPVFYDNTADTKEVMQGINSYYNTGKIPRVIDGMKFSLDEDFATQVDNVLQGKDTSSTHIKVMDTPNILIEIGLQKLPLVMTANHLKSITQSSGNKNVNYHNLSVDIVKKIPELISDPVMIFESLTKEDSIVVLTEAIDHNKKTVIVAVKFDGFGRINNKMLNVNVLTSAYGKDNINSFIERNLNENKLLFLNKKKSQALIVNPGLQLSNVLSNLDSNTIIHQISKKSTKNTKFSLDDDFDIPSDEGFFNAENVKGQTRDTDAIKYRAKLKQDKVFTKEELANVINEALDQTQSMRLDSKTKDIAIGELFERMNSQDIHGRQKTAEDIADFIINTAFYDATRSNNPEYYEIFEESQKQLDIIKSYIGKFKISDQLRTEIRNIYDNKEGNGIALAWGSKEGVNSHDIASELNAEGFNINLDTSEENIFIEIYNKYQALKSSVDEFKQRQKSDAKDVLTSHEMAENRSALIDTILKAYDEKGTKTATAKLKELYGDNLNNIKKELKETKRYAKAYINFLVTNKRAKELSQPNKSYSASVLNDETLQGFLKAVAQIGNIKTLKKNARESVQSLAKVYNLSNKDSLFGDILSQEQESTEIFGVKDSLFDENIADMIEAIAKGEGELTTEEIILLTKITDGLIHLYKTYDKVFKDGKLVETEKLAKEYSEKMRIGIDVRNKTKVLKGMWHIRAMLDPHTVMRNLDGYRSEYNSELGILEDKGFFSEMYKEITDGEVKANVAEIELLKPFGEFFKKHKGFERGLTKDKIKIKTTQIKTNGAKIDAEVEMSIGEAISIYLTSLRPQANFYESSVVLENKDKTTSEYAFNKKQIDELFSKFNDAQKEYIKLVQKFFNVDAKNLKVETDLATLGYTNIEEGDVYFPIKREQGDIAKNLGDTQIVLDAINTFTLSFNKDVKEGAKIPIRISNVYKIIQNHAKGMGAYYGLAVPLKTFNRVFNKQVEAMGKKSLRAIATSQIPGSVKYIDKLLKDIQGREIDDFLDGKILRRMRGSYAKYQLGFNPKTVLGQTSSYMMGLTYLDAGSLAKGLTMKTDTEQMFKYAPFTKYRMQDKAVVKAQGVIDRVGGWTDVFTKPIEWMDNNVVKKLWNASQVQIERNTGHKIGTEENLKLASKLLEKVVRETQSNSINSEKTSLARSKNEWVASLTMFSSDAQKQVSRLVDGLGSLLTAKKWVENGTLKSDSKTIKVAKKQIIRATAGFLTATSMYVMIGMLMKYLLGKRDEEKTLTEEFFGDFESQVAGLIPIYRDFYGYLTDGYEMENYAVSMINDLASGVKAMSDLTEDLISGKQLSKAEIGAPLRKFIYAVSQISGVPFRNMWNYGYGIVNQFSPETAFRMNSLFYDAKMTDLDKSISQGTDRKSIAIIEEIFASKNMKIDKQYAEEVLKLYKEGMNVIPTEIKQNFSYNGEELSLSNAEHKQMLNAMNEVLNSYVSIMNSRDYQNLNADKRKTYLNNIYNLNYILNLADIIGVDNLKSSDYKKYLFSSVLDRGCLTAMSYIATIESDVDWKGNVIANSKKKKIQRYVNSLRITPAEKYILMGYAGYKNLNGESTVKSYLRRNGLSKDEIELMMEWCGY